ncbi:membrane protein insertase YidC [Arcanobacterium hippocoleae]
MDNILFPIMWVIAWIMTGVHKLLTLFGLHDGAGLSWVLSIVGMTIVVRALMIPLFNKQLKSMRMGQQLQPEMQKIQKKYKGRRDPISMQRQREETMALYREYGTSPFASCLPVVIQMPIFFALFRLLYAVNPLSSGDYYRAAIGPINQSVAEDIANSTVFGAPISSSIGSAGSYAPEFSPLSIYIVAVVMIILLIVTLFFTQKQIMTKNMPENAMDPSNPMYKTQKYMLYGMPLIYIFTGTTFQIGVLVYWVTGNFWNMGQQTWMIHNNPAPGSAAYKAKMKREREKRIAKGLPPEEETQNGVNGLHDGQSGQRIQPLGKSRSKKAGASGKVDAFGRPLPGNDHEYSADVHDSDRGEERGADGLTDAERAQKRYERRAAERKRAQEKKKTRQNKQARNTKKRNF